MTEDYGSLVARVREHQAAIVRAQHDVLTKKIDVATYNRVYRENLDAIHALEAKLRTMQG
ncbi:MAG TPA: hypothetical protein VM681_09135 [Candidatus Thermoplasmatota archaeon]|nr:hypothetical protein [Candidatus Thermoplasmatota archaeon]